MLTHKTITINDIPLPVIVNFDCEQNNVCIYTITAAGQELPECIVDMVSDDLSDDIMRDLKERAESDRADFALEQMKDRIRQLA